MSAERSLSSLLELSGSNAGFVQELFELYRKDSTLVDPSWAQLFAGLPNGTNGSHARLSVGADAFEGVQVSLKVLALISAYRKWGHFGAAINPLTVSAPLPKVPELDPAWHGLSDLGARVSVAPELGTTVSEIVSRLRAIYLGSVGFEFEHLVSSEEREFLRARIEGRRVPFSAEDKKRAFRKLVDAEEFEAQLHKKYVGQKRFSVQGGETLIPMLDRLLLHATKAKVKEVVMGKAHRGRLNVLCNIVGKPIADLFAEFEDQSVYSVVGSGDVKYHKGYRSTFHGDDGNSLEVMLAPNPSHLEFVDPVVEGIVRAKQDVHYGRSREAVVPVLMHGDAAFAGQGVVYETLNFSGVEGYLTGGTVHLIVNNQVGFTTDPIDSRSSPYCTDMARGIQTPVFHVNAEDVEAALWVTELALDFRQKFKRDVIIDLYCYRKYGHNEGDDPSFTQPTVYKEVNSKKSIAHLYGEKLIAAQIMTEGEVTEAFNSYGQAFQTAHQGTNARMLGEACAVFGRLRVPTPPTGVAIGTLKKIASTLTTTPEGFTVHPKLLGILQKRVQTLDEGKGIDWGFAEALAYGSLVLEGHTVRLSGQDCGRGTFSHRHLALSDYHGKGKFLPLSALNTDQAYFEVFNSTLSEAGIVGFEFGYSTAAPRALVIWEAQFGDFANGAQVAIDQFISSSESKWEQLSGVVLLLPHGFEGQGPEHSSARLERYLQLCAEGNMVVCYPSNAAQIFHLLRRQGIMEIKRPLVVMTPKSLLRLPEASCATGDLTQGQFEPIIEETIGKNPKKVVLLTGKIYYDVLSALRKDGGVAARIIRIEQLHPFPQYDLMKAVKDVTIEGAAWVQEEPQNMGAWSYLSPYLKDKLGSDPVYIGRPAAASPATGSTKRHSAEQQAIVSEVVRWLKG